MLILTLKALPLRGFLLIDDGYSIYMTSCFFFFPSYLSNEFIGISYVELKGKPFSDLSVLYAFITFISYVKRYAKEGYYNV